MYLSNVRGILQQYILLVIEWRPVSIVYWHAICWFISMLHFVYSSCLANYILRKYQNKSILLFSCEVWKISVNKRMGSIYPVKSSSSPGWETVFLWCNIGVLMYYYEGYLATQHCLFTNRCYIWFLDYVGISMVILWSAITIFFLIDNELNTCLAERYVMKSVFSFQHCVIWMFRAFVT